MRPHSAVFLLLLVLTATLLCPSARAQCDYPFQVQCDTYLEYDVLNNVAWGYSYTFDWMYYCVGGIGVYAELDTPLGSYFPQDTGEYLSAEVDFYGLYDGDGQYSANASHYVAWGPNGTTSYQLQVYQPLPTGEVTRFCNWGGGPYLV